MKTRITPKLLKEVQPSARPYEIVDEELTGFLARVQPTGRISFYYTYRAKDGRRLRSRIGAYPAVTVPSARNKAEKLAAEVVLGANPQQEKKSERVSRQKAKHESLEGFIEHKYKDWALAHQRRGGETIALLQRSFKFLYPKKLSEVSAWEIQKWRTAKSKAGIKPSTINRAVTTLKAVLNKALEWGVIDKNPLQTIKPMKLDSLGVARYLSSSEEASLRAALDDRELKLIAKRESGNAWRRARGGCELPQIDTRFADYLKPMVLLALNTGLRRSELFNLKWGNVSLERKTLTVVGGKAKSGKTRHIPSNSEAHAVLEAWLQQSGGLQSPEDLVFPSPITGRKFDTISKGWRQLRASAGLEDFRFHDLRHTFASKLVMAGVDPYAVKELLGHSTIQMTERYMHLAPEYKAEAIERLVASL